MTTYAVIANSEIDGESGITESVMTRMRDNPIAISEGSTGAPKIQEAAMGSASVNQAALKTTTDSTSTATTGVMTSLAGGEYAFALQVNSNASSQYHIATVISPNTAANTYTGITLTPGGTYTTRIFIGVAGGNTINARHRYIQASPPYNNGPLFIYVIIDKSGNIETVSIAPDPPWANNGPTNIRPDYYRDGKKYKRVKKAKKNNGKLILPPEYDEYEQEITMNYKDSDIDIIPHPFQGNDLTNKTIAIIEPGSDFCCQLAELHESEENVNQLFHDGYIVLDNKSLGMKAPKECMPVSAKWKLTK